MKLKKLYTYNNKRQLWRLLPSAGKIVIEERDLQTKEVFFNCIETDSGKTIFKNFQFEEKYWIDIEAVIDDMILFHKFVKPDLPAHLGIIAFDILNQTVIWETYEYNFLFINNNQVYAFRSGFEGKEFFVLDLYTGELVESLGDNSEAVNIIKQNSYSESYYSNFKFPSAYPEKGEHPVVHEIINKYKSKRTIIGKPDFLEEGNLLLFNFHEVQKNGLLRNNFTAIDIETKKVIFEETLNAASTAIMPDSFFIVDRYLLLLKEKTRLIVCKLI